MRFLRMSSRTTGMPLRSAAAAIGACPGVTSDTRWPRSSMPRASVRMRISCPPQPQEFSVCTMESARIDYSAKSGS